MGRIIRQPSLEDSFFDYAVMVLPDVPPMSSFAERVTKEQTHVVKKALGVDEEQEEDTSVTNLGDLIKQEGAKSAFMDLGLLNDTIVNRENHSPIFNIKGDAVLFQKLKKNNIICSQRGGGIRVGFHFYNSEEDLEALLEILKH